MIYIWQIYCQYFETFFAYFIPNQILLDVKADVILRIVRSHEIRGTSPYTHNFTFCLLLNKNNNFTFILLEFFKSSFPLLHLPAH